MAVPEGRAEVRILLLEDSDIDADLVAAHLAKASLSYTLMRAANHCDPSDSRRVKWLVT